MTAPLEITWATRELPILRGALQRLDAGDDFPDLHEVREALGLDSKQMDAGLRALESASPPYIELEWAGYFVKSVGERARRELGTWPSAETVVDRLAAALADAAERRDTCRRTGPEVAPYGLPERAWGESDSDADCSGCVQQGEAEQAHHGPAPRRQRRRQPFPPRFSVFLT